MSGNFAGEGVSEAGALKQALETHEDAATLTLWLMIGAALVRIAMVVLKKYIGIYRWIGFAIFFLGVISIARTGFYGGELVYKHAAGVQFDLGFGNLDSSNSENSINNERLRKFLMRLLVIEDEKGIANFLRDGLTEEYFAVDIAYDGKTGLQMALSNEYDLLLVDWMLPWFKWN